MTSRPLPYLFSRIFVAMILLVSGISCNVVDPQNPAADPIQPTIAQSIILQVDRLIPNLPTGSIGGTLDKTVEAVVTIHTEDGKPTAYNLKRIKVNHEAGVYKTEKIDLAIGNYQITTFYVLGEDNEVSSLAPLKNSPLGNQVDKALPYSFAVSNRSADVDGLDGDDVRVIVLPTLDTEGRKPEDFGLHSFRFDIKDVFYAFIALVGSQEVLDFKSGKLFITAEGYEYTQVLGANINKTVPLPVLGRYHVKAESKGFKAFNGSFSLDSLLTYTSRPLIIEMQEETIECVGGSYLWDVLLESQTDVENFSLRCHTQINGSLIVANTSKDNPIVDLTPLSQLTAIGNSLEISRNSQLESLDGLQNITLVSGQVAVTQNEKLKTLEGLKGLSNIQSKLEISDNPSLIRLDGLNGLSAISILFVQGNNKLQNLAGLDNLTQVGHISLAYNESLNSLQGLHRLKEINRLTITGNNELISLDGFENGVESIQSLEVYYNSKLKDFTGMLSPNGKIKSSMELVSTSVASLEGLSFPSDIPFGIHIEDNALRDISALKSIEKIGRSLTIASNINLESLSGLENLSSVGNGNQKDNGYQLRIYDNWLIEDFCPLTDLFTKGIYYKVNIESNGYNPSIEDIKENQCKL